MVMGDAHSRVLVARLAVGGVVCAAGAAGVANLLLPVHSPAVVPAVIEAGPAVVAVPTEVLPSFDGTGMRYAVIYLANREQIRDPRLIYPGQAFAVPTASP